MTVLQEYSAQNRAAKTAGILYFLIIASSILSMLIGPFKLMVPGDAAKTFANISEHQLLFRGGIVYDLLMYTAVVALAISLYVVLKPVNRNLALLAMSWRIGEAILGGVAVLANLNILQLVDQSSIPTAFTPDQLEAMVGLLLGANAAAISVVFVFLSLGSILFCYLFLRSGYIPKGLAWFGLLAFALTLVGTLVGVIVPNNLTMLFGTPAILFELTIGLWLWVKGIRLEPAS